MKTKNFSRRDFLRAALIGCGAAFLAACEWLIKPKALPKTIVPSPNTDTPEPTATATQTSTATQTPTATVTQMPTQISCLNLLTPANNAELDAIGKVTFSWQAMQGAASYKLEITLPTGQVISFNTNGVSRDQYLEAIKMAGIFQWRVIALDNSGAVICTSDPFTFEKPEYKPPQNNGGNGGGNGSSSTGSSGSWSSGSDG